RARHSADFSPYIRLGENRRRPEIPGSFCWTLPNPPIRQSTRGYFWPARSPLCRNSRATPSLLHLPETPANFYPSLPAVRASASIPVALRVPGISFYIRTTISPIAREPRLHAFRCRPESIGTRHPALGISRRPATRNSLL